MPNAAACQKKRRCKIYMQRVQKWLIAEIAFSYRVIARAAPPSKQGLLLQKRPARHMAHALQQNPHKP
jgi:hypothetical protein